MAFDWLNENYIVGWENQHQNKDGFNMYIYHCLTAIKVLRKNAAKTVESETTKLKYH